MDEALAFCPPMIINEQELDAMFDIAAAALDDTLKQVRAAYATE